MEKTINKIYDELTDEQDKKSFDKQLNNYEFQREIEKRIWKEAQKEHLEEIKKIYSSCCKYKQTYPRSGVYTGDTEFNFKLFEKKIIELESKEE